jgi:hypothetical protein
MGTPQIKTPVVVFKTKKRVPALHLSFDLNDTVADSAY